MSASHNHDLAAVFRRLVNRLFRRRKGRAAKLADSIPHRAMHFEPLEGRALLASDLASIAGIVSLGGSPVVGATVEVFQDADSDGLFEPGGDDGAALDTDTTGATGGYRFDGLTAGDYFVRQPAQPGLNLGEFVSDQITIMALQAGGVLGTTIDDFSDSTPQTVTANSGTPVTSAADHPGALGGERDLSATLTSGGAGENVTLDSQSGRLMFNSSLSAQGLFSSIYDGDDNDADNLDATGLAPRDLTQGGATSIKVTVETDQPNAHLVLRIHTDATHFSETAPFTIPGGNVATDVVFDFATDFSQGGVDGPADFANVGAIEMVVDTTTDGTDGLVTLLGAFGPTAPIQQDIDNEADLSLTKDVDDPAPDLNQQVVFTLTLANASGGAGATNVEVNDLLPAGLTFDSANPAADYDNTTGIWTVGSLAAGATATLTITATVTSLAPIDNVATITAADQTDPDLTNNSDAAQVDAEQADLSLTKTVDDPTPTAGQEVVFTLTVANSGPDDATGVEVTDQLPAGLIFVSASPAADYDDATGIWTVGAVASGASEVLTIHATVNNLAALTNVATITAADQGDPDQENNSDSAQVDVPEADLSLTKDVDDPTPDLNQQVVFTLIVTNNGPEDATGVAVTDQLPAGLTFVSANPPADYNSATGVWSVGALANGASETLTITATVTSPAAISNPATITAADQADPNTQNNSDSAQVDVPEADLSIDKTVDDPAPDLNQQVVFTLTVTNSGPNDATGVAVTDQLPSGLTFVSANPAADYDNNTGIWTIGALANGASETLTITVTVTSAAAINNTATITDADQLDPDSTDNSDSASVDVPEADLSIDKSVNNTAPTVGQQVVFTLVVTNNGPNDATGVAVTDQLPSGLTFVSANPAADYNSATGVWTVGALANGASETLTITATVASAAQITNPATITASDQLDPNTNNNSDSANVDAPSADLSLAKQVSNPTPNFGSNVTFTLTLTNNGTDQATGVAVTDLLPSGLTFQSATAAAGTTYNSTTGVWTVGTLNNGANVTLSIVARVDSTAAITNIAEVTASGVFDPDSTPGNGNTQEDDRATATVDAPAAADLRLAKTVNNSTPLPGQQVVFTLTLTNDGPDQATNVTVTDTLPSGLTFVSSNPSQGSFNSGTGVWTVGSVNSGANATLAITATVSSAASFTNVAQVTASDQFDPDSTPNNNAAGEDDRASAAVNSVRFSKRLFLSRTPGT